MSLDASVWGPHFWFFLHSAALKYPMRPTSATKKRFYEFITNFYLFIPVEAMAINFCKLIDQYPLVPYLDSRDSLVRWVHFIHNKVNEKLEKNKISLSKFYELHYEMYKPHEVKRMEYNKFASRAVYATIVVFAIAIIVHFYKK